MILTAEEQEMLDGKQGEAKQKAMEVLVGLGECFDAERMLPIKSSHLPGCNLVVSGKRSGRAAWVKDLADKKGRFVTLTTINVTAHDSVDWKYLGLDEQFVEESEAHVQNFAKMGAMLCNTCTPYLVGQLPAFGEHVAWGESSAIIFINSVLGARTNREGAPSALASALTGRTPAFGLHLDENRIGELKIVVEAKLKTISDFGTLGYFAGKRAGMRIPVFTGLSHPISWDCLKTLGAATANSGGSAMYHIVGVTPEAPTEAAAFGHDMSRASEAYVFGENELRETEALLSQAKNPEVDIVVVGCPNASISEIQEVAELLEGRKIHSGTQFWLLTSRMVRAYAEKMGYLQAIEAAGGKFVSEACTATIPAGLLKKRGFKSPATNSAKMVFFLAGNQDLDAHYGSTQKCVQAAVDGVWS